MKLTTEQLLVYGGLAALAYYLYTKSQAQAAALATAAAGSSGAGYYGAGLSGGYVPTSAFSPGTGGVADDYFAAVHGNIN